MLELMNARVTIKRRTPVQDGLRINPGTPAIIATKVPCLIQEDAGAVRPHDSTGDRLSYIAIAFFPISTDIEPRKGTNKTDIIVVESHPSIPAGSEFLCVHVTNQGGVLSMAAQHLEAYLSTP